MVPRESDERRLYHVALLCQYSSAPASAGRSNGADRTQTTASSRQASLNLTSRHVHVIHQAY